jgi:hypothetical protein
MAHFDILAKTVEAATILKHPLNSKLTRTSGKVPFLRIPFTQRSKKPPHLLSFGSDPEIADIFLGASRGYDALHCYIYIHPVSGVLVLHDASTSKSTKLSDQSGSDYDFRANPRARVIPTSKTAILSIRDAQFQFIWHDTSWKRRKDFVSGRSDIDLSSFEPRRLPEHTFVRYMVRKRLQNREGSKVSLVVDLGSGDLLVVKELIPVNISEEDLKKMAKREVKFISDLSGVSFSHLWRTRSRIDCLLAPDRRFRTLSGLGFRTDRGDLHQGLRQILV